MLLLNGQNIDYFLFSGGEFQVKLPHKLDPERAILTWKPINASDITFLSLVINALKNMGICDIDLDILYLPYARQDRVCSPGQANSLEVICRLLDSMELTTIRIWDVHNMPKTMNLFTETHVCFISAKDIFARFKILDEFDNNETILCAPDNGACWRVSDIAEHFDFYTPIMMSKGRHPETGFIEGMKWNPQNRSVEGWSVLIIDDICDGGATFNAAAQIIREQGATNLYLYITHGIFSKGLDLLQENFKHIICHHVLHDDHYQSTDRLTILREFKHVS